MSGSRIGTKSEQTTPLICLSAPDEERPQQPLPHLHHHLHHHHHKQQHHRHHQNKDRHTTTEEVSRFLDQKRALSSECLSQLPGHSSLRPDSLLFGSNLSVVDSDLSAEPSAPQHHQSHSPTFSHDSHIRHTTSVSHDHRDVSQTSLLTTVSSVHGSNNSVRDIPSCSDDNRRAIVSETYPMALCLSGGASVSVATPTADVSRVFRPSQMTKSLSSGAILDLQTCSAGSDGDSVRPRDEETSASNEGLSSESGRAKDALATDNTDSASVAKMARWDTSTVDVEATEIMLENLDEHINNTRQKLKDAIFKKDENVCDLISGFMNQSSNSPDDMIRKNFEQKNKTTEKSLEKMHKYLEELEYRRNIIYQEGIPRNVDPKNYVKHLPSNRKSKKRGENAEKEISSVVSKFLKNSTHKSASAENVSNMSTSKDVDWFKKKGTDKSGSSPHHHQQPRPSDETQQTKDRSATLDSGRSKGTTTSSSNNDSLHRRRPGEPAAGGSSNMVAPSTAAVASYQSHSNSVCSGRDVCHPPIDLVSSADSPRKNSTSVLSVESGGGGHHHHNRLEDTLEKWRRSIMEDVERRRSDTFDRFRYDVNCKLDSFRSDLLLIRDETDGLKNQMKELHDKIDKNTSDFNQKVSMNSISLTTNLKNLEEKLDYQMELARRVLQDKIDSCSNNINLIEKRTEQLPMYSKYNSDKSDVKIITDHFFNLVVSLIAFIMLLMSSGFHLLIKCYNFGAAISRHKYKILPPMLVLAVGTALCVQYSLLDRLSQQDLLPPWLSLR